MKKPKKTTFYAVICPVCGWKTVGNWKELQVSDYLTHCWKEHIPKPYIKTERR